MSRPDVIVATDPKGDFSRPEIIAVRGVQNSILNTIPVVSTNTGFQVNWQAPNPSSLISRKMRLRGSMNLSVAWTSTGAGVTTLQIAPRQYPLHQIATTFSQWINNQNVGGQTYGEFAIPVMKYLRDLEENTPSAPVLSDFWTEYAGVTGALPTNVLGDASQVVKGRAGFPGFVVTGAAGASGGGANTTTVRIDFDEPFLFGGAYSLDKDAPALTNVSTLQWAVNFSSNLAKLLSIPSGQTGVTNNTIVVSAAAGGLFTNMSILVESFDPSPFMKLPSKAYYPIDRYDFQTSAVATTVAGGATAVGLTSPVITCPAVPTKMYVFAKPAQSATHVNDSDFVARITALQINMDSKPLLTTMDATSLALMSIGNGFRTDFDEVAHVQGSAIRSYARHGVVAPGICLVFGKDIALPAEVVSGSSGQHTIQCIATVQNQSTTSYPLFLQVVLVYDEVLEVSQGMAQVMPVNISPAESVQEGHSVAAEDQGGGLKYHKRHSEKSGAGVSGGGSTGGGRTGGLMARLKK